MSWMPAQEPVLGDKRTCDALDLIIVPRVRDLGGGFSVHRALPHAKRQMVGPFIFFDQIGPVQLIAGRGMDVRPHPHIGLATVTYLFDGRVVHREARPPGLRARKGPERRVPGRVREGARCGGRPRNRAGSPKQIHEFRFRCLPRIL
jgi:Pirin